MRNLVQIEVWKEIWKNRKYTGTDRFLYSFLIDLTDSNWTYGGFSVVEDTLRRHGKGHIVLAQDFKDLNDNGQIDFDKGYSVMDFYDLNDPI